jgi:hypothetical protein
MDRRKARQQTREGVADGTGHGSNRPGCHVSALPGAGYCASVDEGLRTVAVMVGWVTVAGGLLLAVSWLALGGGRAFGPEDELTAQAGVPVTRYKRQFTALSSAQVGMHGFFGLLTASLLTYAAARSDDRSSGYLAVLVVGAITAVPGLLMFRKWRSSRRPARDGDPAGDVGPKVEDRLPRAAVYLHGLAATSLIALVIVLLAVE